MSGEKKIPYSKEELYGIGEQRSYTGSALKEVAFPLGGIGTGTISLGGRGDLRDWEIFNRPFKTHRPIYTFPTIWAKTESGEPIARVLEAHMLPPFTQSGGMPPGEMCGLPRLKGAVIKGEYPVAKLEFIDEKLPVKVELTAFNPFIPLNEKDSAIPAAILRYKVTNTSKEKVNATVCWTMQNSCGNDGKVKTVRKNENYGQQENKFVDDGAFRGIKMTQSKHTEDDVRFGTMALVTTHKDVTYLEAWTRTGWWDDAQSFWDDFKADGEFTDNGVHDPSPDNTADIANLGLKVSLAPGESAELPFIITWHFPNSENHWNKEESVRGSKLRNRYADWYKDAWEVASYLVENLERLEAETLKFKNALYSSTLPAVVLDAVGTNMSIIRTTTGVFFDDDRFYGFEGCADNQGCCPMNCTHVYNYEQALAYLFPRLESTMRLTDFTDNVAEDGKMAFRTMLPRGKTLWQFHAAADGQMGCILKLYREYLLSGDEKFVKQLYPGVKKAMEYAWIEWDKDQDGVMEGIQHNTYDIEFLGPNTMMGTIYLGALKVMVEFATLCGDPDFAAKCADLYDKGTKNYAEQLWNGDFYVQKYDPMLAPKHQFGEGCLSDQLLGQWFCEVVGIGHVLPADQVRKTLESIFKYNWRSDLSAHDSVQRSYAMNDEAGLLLCTWPKGGRVDFPFVYADEVWTGIEYQVAAHMIYEGMLDEGLAIVKGVRDRHDGIARNPWNEFECGHHYARAMASWSLILALSGYQYSAPEKSIAFAPKVNAADFRCFYTTGSGWGVFSQKINGTRLTAGIGVTWGDLELQTIKLAAPSGYKCSQVSATLGGKTIAASLSQAGGAVVVTLSQAAKIATDETLELTLS